MPAPDARIVEAVRLLRANGYVVEPATSSLTSPVHIRVDGKDMTYTEFYAFVDAVRISIEEKPETN